MSHGCPQISTFDHHRAIVAEHILLTIFPCWTTLSWTSQLKKHELKTSTIQLRLKNVWQPFRLKQSHICHHHLTLVRGTGSRMSLKTHLGCQTFGIDPQRIPCDLTPVRSIGILIHQSRIIQTNPKTDKLETSFQTWFRHVCTIVESWLLNLGGLKTVTGKLLPSTTSFVISRALLTKKLG